MKKSKNIFKALVVIFLLFSLPACQNLYVTKHYTNSQCYQFVDEYLQGQGWERIVESDKVVFVKGQSVKLTFNYDAEGPEVQVHLEQKENGAFDVSVGNFGMVGEIHQMENRFERISEKLDEKIKEKC